MQASGPVQGALYSTVKDAVPPRGVSSRTREHIRTPEQGNVTAPGAA